MHSQRVVYFVSGAAGMDCRLRDSAAAARRGQVFDNARVAAGTIDDPRAMLSRLNDICAAALSGGGRLQQ